MAMTPTTGLIHRLRAATGRGNDRESTDAELLNAYISCGDGMAFEAIVRRHGRMVLSLCRRLLRNHADADDAFQATFLVLVRKAASIRPRNMLPGWLYGVAYKASLKVRTSSARRQTKEREMQAMPRIGREGGPVEADVLDALDRELARLPDDLRSAVVLCELEGKTRKEAARELGWPEGTVASRLARGRGVLAQRLAPFNVSLGAGSLAALSPTVCPAIVPASLYVSVAEAASAFAAGFSTAAPAPAVAIAEGVIKSMFLSKLKASGLALAVCATLGLVGPGVLTTTTVAAPAIPVSKGTPTGRDAPAKKVASFDHNLLHSEAILKDLNCTDEQKEKIDATFKEATAAMQQQIGNVQIAVPAGGAVGGIVAAMPLINFRQQHKDLTAKLSAGLKSEQLSRLRELDLRGRGPRAFVDRKVVRALQLTEDQEDRIEEIVAKYEQEDMMGAFPVPGPGAFDSKPLAEVSDKATATCVKLLTKEQAQAWQKLIGKAIPTADVIPSPFGGFGVGFAQTITIRGAGIALPAPALPIAPPAPVAPAEKK